jgi:hypothetical protein
MMEIYLSKYGMCIHIASSNQKLVSFAIMLMISISLRSSSMHVSAFCRIHAA